VRLYFPSLGVSTITVRPQTAAGAGGSLGTSSVAATLLYFEALRRVLYEVLRLCCCKRQSGFLAFLPKEL
jgi:hypothetical protein